MIYAPETLHRAGRIVLGICTSSFALEQGIYIDNTAHLVPKWLPPGQMFWAITTTVPFALAGVANRWVFALKVAGLFCAANGTAALLYRHGKRRLAP